MSGDRPPEVRHFWEHIPCNGVWETRVEQVRLAIKEWTAHQYRLIHEPTNLPDMVRDMGILLEFIFPSETPREEIQSLMAQMGSQELDRLMQKALEHEDPGHCCESSGCFHCCECYGCSKDASRYITF